MGKITTFTSESVCSGHPDKICDQISDAVLDAAYEVNQDPKKVRVAVETMVTANKVFMAGEVTSQVPLDYHKICREVIRDLGYTDPVYGFSDRSEIFVAIHQQSPDIALGVNAGGAGDQGMMFGYACSETKELMPLPIVLAHRLAARVDQARKEKLIKYLRPDGKTEVTVRYKDGRPVAVERLILAVPYGEQTEDGQLKDDLYKEVVKPVLESFRLKFPEKKVIVNGTGRWHQGGPAADTGVTGRKIIVDTYGGMARHGGGCFSGKDPTKVDRSGAYACRFVAKNLVAHGLAERVEIRVAYVIGKREPIDFYIETFGTQHHSQKEIEGKVQKLLDFSVPSILETLSLQRVIPYRQTACYGHFGRDGFPWEKVVEI